MGDACKHDQLKILIHDFRWCFTWFQGQPCSGEAARAAVLADIGQVHGVDPVGDCPVHPGTAV
jgi:hypothetical protein